MSVSAMVLPDTALHQQTRTLDQQPVLHALPDEGPSSRVDLNRLAGLARILVGGSDRAPPHRLA